MNDGKAFIDFFVLLYNAGIHLASQFNDHIPAYSAITINR
ncbi:hypothetical protein RG47T_1496 [Mucilaginibacter polytrichastri]|uniref:Uncharacterized protein n=2 Tax=Mucilaginibacter polytrichastri TaxID=1302689 RepID=A0A1Q5ZWB1_9SPHI|nr:hypothetical protein RG47T_1496 [Mucilaginibacter polytrichastri]